MTPILSATRHLVKSNGSIVGSDVAKVVRANHSTFLSAIAAVPTTTNTHHPALASIDGRASLSHKRVVEFGESIGYVLQKMGVGRGDRVALVLPNGPELALALVAVANWATAVPLNANGAVSELEADLLRCGARLVIGPGSYTANTTGIASRPEDAIFHVPSASRRDWTSFGFVEETAKKLGIAFSALIPSDSEAGIFALQPSKSTVNNADCSGTPEPNRYDDAALVLFTSGTTGDKKLVPHNMGDMLTAAATIALSWSLTASDVNCNLMPLFHVGGIVRQIFSPLISGGCVICCPAFDPSIFWELLQHHAFTWYYAAPTMHHLILQLGKAEGMIAPNKPRLTLRMIANAAGGLLPSLAEEMRETFGANVSRYTKRAS
eukprot:scaffold22432_cov168-Amphora_coffeaeformis.AAC.13